jgi:hypothetical protein
MTTDNPSQERPGEEPPHDLTAAIGNSSSSVVPAQDVDDTEIVLADEQDDQTVPRLLPQAAN